MPNVLDKFAKYKSMIASNCDVCRKPATFQLDIIPNKTLRPWSFCDKCMKRNQHLWFSSNIEAQKFFATYLRRINKVDLPPLHN